MKASEAFFRVIELIMDKTDEICSFGYHQSSMIQGPGSAILYGIGKFCRYTLGLVISILPASIAYIATAFNYKIFPDQLEEIEVSALIANFPHHLNDEENQMRKAGLENSILLKDLIQCIHPYTQKAALAFWKAHHLEEIEISAPIADFFHHLNDEENETKWHDFEQFISEFKRLSTQKNNDQLKKILIHMVLTIAEKIYEKHRNEIKISKKLIDQSLKDKTPILQKTNQTAKFIGLVNMYHILSIEMEGGQLINLGHNSSFAYPSHPMREILSSEIAFAINALTLTGQLSKADFNGINTAKALYPIGLQVNSEDKVSHRRGIKISDDYFPYKSAKKLAQGDTGDTTFVATNGKKALFVRGSVNGNYKPLGIMASKIATLISKTHFSSERLMDNKIAASRALPAYAVSATDGREINETMGRCIKAGRVFFGTGLVDEVCNFICEADSNIENYGLSSTDITNPETHISKIDFNLCAMRFDLSDLPIIPSKQKQYYDYNILTRSVYCMAPNDAKEDRQYKKEKFYARLKLSMLNQPLLQGLAAKSFINSNEPKVQKIVEAIVKQSDIALELFWGHEYAKQLLEDNPELLNQCYQEIVVYIHRHFNQAEHEIMIRSLNERVIKMNVLISDALKLQLLKIDLQSFEVNNVYTKKGSGNVSFPKPFFRDHDGLTLQTMEEGDMEEQRALLCPIEQG